MSGRILWFADAMWPTEFEPNRMSVTLNEEINASLEAQRIRFEAVIYDERSMHITGHETKPARVWLRFSGNDVMVSAGVHNHEASHVDHVRFDCAKGFNYHAN